MPPPRIRRTVGFDIILAHSGSLPRVLARSIRLEGKALFIKMSVWNGRRRRNARGRRFIKPNMGCADAASVDL